MDAQTQDQIQNLQRQIDELQQQFKKLESNATIPLLVGEAFKARLGSLKDFSTKTAASETIGVNESGSSSYDVSAPPDGFYRTADGKNIPYFND